MKKIQIVFLTVFILFTSKANAQSCNGANYVDFGINEWIVHVYQTTNIDNISATNWKGFYKQKLDINNNLGVNTTLQWTATANSRPTLATNLSTAQGVGTAYTGCAIDNQDFTFVHKRKGFPPGNYELYIDQWDDQTNIYLNGVRVKSMATYGSNQYGLKCIKLDANSILEVRTDNRGGGISQLKLRILPSNASVSISGANASICPLSNTTLTAVASHTPINGNATNITANLTTISWTGGPSTGSTNAVTFTARPITTTEYTLAATFEYCTFSTKKIVTVNQPTPPIDFGPNTWYVYGYTGSTTTANIAPNTHTYFGYYTQNLNSTTNYGFQTNATTSNGWEAATTPSNSATWQGCTIPSDDITYIHKRKGFPCGTYQIKADQWDKRTRIFINGVEIGYQTNACTANCNTLINGIYQLDANSTIEVRTNNETGNSLTALKITPIVSTTLALNNEQRTCPVKGNQWVHFYTSPEGRYLASVKGTTPTSDLGAVTVTNYVDAANQIAIACDNPNYKTAVMQRHWVINPTLNGEAEVRLPYTSTEFSNLVTASNATTNPDDDVFFPNQSSVKLSKYAGPTHVNNLVNDNCNGSTTLFTSIANGTPGNYYYQDFKIPGFSEFWLHGMDHVSPLNEEMHAFEITCTNSEKKITVIASIDKNHDHLILESSSDGLVWNEVSGEQSQVDKQTIKTFQFTSPTTRAQYYRVKTITKNGKESILQTIQGACESAGQKITVYPNPANNLFQIQLNDFTTPSVEIYIQDLTGKILETRKVEINSFTQTVQFDSSNYAKGMYVIDVKSTEPLLISHQHLIIQ